MPFVGIAARTYDVAASVVFATPVAAGMFACTTFSGKKPTMTELGKAPSRTFVACSVTETVRFEAPAR